MIKNPLIFHRILNFLSIFFTFIHESEDGKVVKIWRNFRLNIHNINFNQELINNLYSTHRESLFSLYGEPFKDIEYDYFHKYFYPSYLYGDINHLSNFKIRIWIKKGKLYRHIRYTGNCNLIESLMLHFSNLLESFLRKTHNKKISLKSQYEVSIFEYKEHDFRNSNNFKYLRRNFKCNIFLMLSIVAQFKHFFRRDVVFLVNQKTVLTKFRFSQSALIQQKLELNRKSVEYYKNLLNNKNCKIVIGIDDPSFIRPLLNALNSHGIPSVGLQHGLYGDDNFGYDEIELSSNWFSYVIFWDDWSRLTFQKLNPSFNQIRLLVGTNFFHTFVARIEGVVSEEFTEEKIFICGEENVNSIELDELQDSLIACGFNLISLNKGGKPGLRSEILYVRSIDDIDFSSVALIIGAKSSLAHKLSRLGIPVLILNVKEGYLWDFITRFSSPKTLSEKFSFIKAKYLCYEGRVDPYELDFEGNIKKIISLCNFSR